MVRCIRSDETPHVEYMRTALSEIRARTLVTANGGTIEGEEYFPLDHTDYSKTVEKIMSSGTEG